MEYFIPLNTPSLKNSKIKTSRGVFMSKTCKKYLDSLGISSYSSRDKEVTVKRFKVNLFKEAFKEWKKPSTQIVLGFHFVRGTKREFDFNNANQILLDLMTAHDLIEDDNMKWIVPQAYKKDGAYFSYDKENPGVYIKIIE